VDARPSPWWLAYPRSMLPPVIHRRVHPSVAARYHQRPMLDWLEDDELEGDEPYEDTSLQDPKLSANEANSMTTTLASEAATIWLMTGAGRELVTFADLFHRPTWQTSAGCRGMNPNLFFPARGESTAPAMAVCASCEVRQECQDAALADPATSGIWGGLSERGRREMRRGRAVA
jgi:WhiB family transcriptional regulator, redox-sensing transcriptional regulator